MRLYYLVTFRTFTIWVLAAILNGIFSGIYLPLTDEANFHAGEFILIIFLSLFFAAPGFFMFWLIMILSVQANVYGRPLFRAALSTAFILAIITAILCSEIFYSFSPSSKYIMHFFVILSAITSIMMHFRAFKKIVPKENSIN